MHVKSLLIFTIAIFFSFSALAQHKYTRQEYIDTYKEIAISQMKSHGIPASITLAQGCLESGDGNSTLAVKANNHFGIKCHDDWKGPRMKMDDDAKNECFRKYKKAEESYKDHADFIRYRDRYSSLFALKITDYKGWCYGLKKCGYATHPQYAQMLIKIIEDYKLYQYDTGKPGKKGVAPTVENVASFTELVPLKHSPLYKYSANRTIYARNKTPFILANKNDTYPALAKEYNLFTRELLHFNELRKDQPLKAGTMVYLQRKRAKAPRKMAIHIAETGDTYAAISQRYGVRLSKILKYNDAGKKDAPKEGDEVRLRK